MDSFSWPLYFKERLYLGSPDSNVGIVTCWTPVSRFVGQLDKNSFCVIGQLFTKRGINFVIRNILANPKIRYLVVCGNDQNDSGKALVCLFKKGIDKNHNIKGVENAVIDREIPRDKIELLRKKVKLINLLGINDPQKLKKEISNLPLLKPFSDPVIFPGAKFKAPKTYPSEFCLFTIHRPTVGTAWVEILKHILKFGTYSRHVDGNKLRELLNLAVVVEEEDPEKAKIYKFFPFGKKEVADYIKKVFIKDRGREPYTYGERLYSYEGIDQVDLMVEKLRRFPEDHGALAVLWQPKVDNFGIRKPWRTPCLSLIQGQIFNKKFYLTAYFRSSDMFGAWPLNAFALRNLQGKLARKLKAALGPLTTISNMAHLYEHDFVPAQRVLEKADKYFFRWDPRGNFVVKVEGKEIVVELLSPEGRKIGEYRQDGTAPKAARELCQKLEKDLAISEIGNATDIGRQTAFAEVAIKLEISFVQDQPLRLKKRLAQNSRPG